MTSWPGFHVEHEDRAGAAWVLVAGELDIGQADGLADAIAQAAQRSGSIVLDLSAVTFCDSSGLAALLLARRRHADLRFVPGEAVLEITRLACVEEALFGEQAASGGETLRGDDAASL